MNIRRAGCGESRTSGSEGGPRKPSRRKPARAPRPDPYAKLATELRNRYLTLYVVLDLFSRFVLAWMVSAKENSALARQLMREAALSLALSHEFTRKFVDPRQVQPYTYSASPLTSFPGRDAEFTAGPKAGAAIINRKVAHNDYLLDHLERGFTGLYFCEQSQISAVCSMLFGELTQIDPVFKPIVITKQGFSEDQFTVIEDTQSTIFEGYGAIDGSFYLLRPDRHVAARWRVLNPQEVRRALTIALGGPA